MNLNIHRKSKVFIKQAILEFFFCTHKFQIKGIKHPIVKNNKEIWVFCTLEKFLQCTVANNLQKNEQQHLLTVVYFLLSEVALNSN